jgi:hypothetical protein
MKGFLQISDATPTNDNKSRQVYIRTMKKTQIKIARSRECEVGNNTSFKRRADLEDISAN